MVPWFRKWAELEQVAVSIRSYQPLLVPGLLQTEAYAQAILDAEAPPRLVAVIDEVVLRRVVGDRAVMAGQVAHLAALAGREHVQVRVIPAESPWHTGLAGPFVLAGLPDGTELAYIDNQLRGQVVSDPVDVASLGRRWESVTGEALPRRQSIELIREVATTWS
ncbi:DUF5753 domain-containing protein [Micromonospora haikouensis]|uniref:DUF5753 domain-containing protein n=1 Tax=Micromonospora haikouensis TaxID=686309 RepID=UPI0037B173E7